MKTSKIEFTRINNDVNGNPRYVCHFLSLLNDNDIKEVDALVLKEKIANKFSYRIDTEYRIAIKKANKIGGKKYHNKKFGGGIVFQSYNIYDTEKRILELN
jgi:hypothetical protein